MIVGLSQLSNKQGKMRKTVMCIYCICIWNT